MGALEMAIIIFDLIFINANVGRNKNDTAKRAGARRGRPVCSLSVSEQELGASRDMIRHNSSLLCMLHPARVPPFPPTLLQKKHTPIPTRLEPPSSPWDLPVAVNSY